jgi:TolA-binding protein
MKYIQLFLVMSFLGLTFTLSASKVEKGFKQLIEKDYYGAKKSFEKAFDKYPSGSSFGLAVIYFRTDNPFHNIDSAYRLVRVAEKTFSDVSSKKKDKWQAYGYTKSAIQELKEKISTSIFEGLKGNTDYDVWATYLMKNPDARESQRATELRDSLAYQITLSKNTSEGYSEYIKTYPRSDYYSDARSNFFITEYREQTKDGEIVSYDTFSKNFKGSPFAQTAEDMVYEMATSGNTTEDLKKFIDTYQGNRNTEDAWRRLYQVYMYDYSDDRIKQFSRDFPDYPYAAQIEQEIKRANLKLVPAKYKDRFGAMDMNGVLQIAPDYDLLGMFYEGLAVAVKNNKCGFINKGNELVVPFKYDYCSDFETGRAIVELDGKLGIIDRSGREILAPQFDDIGLFSEGLVYAQKEGRYGYYDKFGDERIARKFEEAYSFADGVAKIEIGGKQGFVNALGEYVVEPIYDALEVFTDKLLIYTDNNLSGIVDKKLNILVVAEFDKIGPLSHGLAMVVKDSKLGYIDSAGTVQLELIFDEFPNCIELGLFRQFSALVKFKGKYGIVDKNKKFVVPNVYENLGAFSTAMAFSKGKKWGFVDLSNKIIIQPKYDFAESFGAGGGLVVLDGKYGVIDISGNEVVSIQQDEVISYDIGRFVTRIGDKIGIYAADGKVIVPYIYDEVRQLGDDYYVMTRGEMMDYLYLPENKVISLKLR